jgi:outer membrane receptor protein involved in Fe transport
MKNMTFRKSLTAAAVAASLGFPAFAVAQDAQTDVNAEEQVERIQVTGSRIRRADIEGANPVSVFTSADLEKVGITDVGDFIQRMPAMSGSPIGTTTNNGGSGAVTVNLRGLGSARTLTLVNGRRTVDGGDFQTIPASMIERIEVLKDGASAVYGADAVAGVVNVITKKSVQGVEVDFQYRTSTETENDRERTLSIVTGREFADGDFVFGVDITEQSPVYQGDTEFDIFQNPYAGLDGASVAQNGPTATGPNANAILLGSGSVPCGQIITPSGNYILEACQDGEGSFESWDGAGYVASRDDFREYVGSGPGNDTYNYAPVNYIQTPYTKINVFSNGSFKVADDVEAYTELRVNKRESQQLLAATPYDTAFNPAFSPDIAVSPDNYYNPFDEDVTRVRRRVLEVERGFTQDILQGQAVLGMRGYLTDTWSFDVNYNYGYRSRTDIDTGQFTGSRLERALGPSFEDADGNIVCGTPGNVVDGCVPMNVFGGNGSITPDMLDYVGVTLSDHYRSQLDTFNASVSGDLFELPAGWAGAAFGYEYRRDWYSYSPDSGKAQGTVTGNTGGGTEGSIVVNSLFGEVALPLLSGAPLAEILEADVGFRYDDFSTFGSETTFQAGLRWQPVDGLLVRGTYGEVFRAPTIGDLYSPQVDSFPSGSDPCRATNWGELSGDQQANCVAQGVPQGGHGNDDSQLRAKVGGNEELQPESGDTTTIGLAWSPEFADGFNVTLDWYKIDIENVIDSVSAQNTLNGCVNGVQYLCDLVTRRDNGTLQQIVALPQNLTSRVAEGIDAEFEYNFPTEIGEFRAFLGWTHVLKRENTVVNEFGNLETVDLAGTFDQQYTGETYAEDKANFTLDWFWEDLTVSYAAEYIGGLDYEFLYVPQPSTVDSQMYHDLSVAYDSEWGTRFSIGLTNITDEEPPYIDGALNGSTDPSTYRVLGRGAFFRVSHTF